METYNSTISFWDNVFIGQEPKKEIVNVKLNRDLKRGIEWVSTGTSGVVDYGCGSGTPILTCAERENISRCVGIDISQNAINLARKTAILNKLEKKTEFICGGVEKLEEIKENSFDGAILSNIIDNVIPEDTIKILKSIERIVVPGGKVLIKLNPYLETKDLKENGLKLMDKDFYVEKEGLYLRNLPISEWKRLIERFFFIEEYKEIYIEEFDQSNRMFMLTNKKIK